MNLKEKNKRIDEKLKEIGIKASGTYRFLPSRILTYIWWVTLGFFGVDCFYLWDLKSRIKRFIIINTIAVTTLVSFFIFKTPVIGTICSVFWLTLWIFNGLTLNRDIKMMQFNRKLDLYCFEQNKRHELNHDYNKMNNVMNELKREGITSE